MDSMEFPKPLTLKGIEGRCLELTQARYRRYKACKEKGASYGVWGLGTYPMKNR